MPDDASDTPTLNGRPAPEEPVLLASRYRRGEGDEDSMELGPAPDPSPEPDDEDVPL